MHVVHNLIHIIACSATPNVPTRQLRRASRAIFQLVAMKPIHRWSIQMEMVILILPVSILMDPTTEKVTIRENLSRFKLFSFYLSDDEEKKTVIAVFCFALINREIVILEFRRNTEMLFFFFAGNLFKRNLLWFLVTSAVPLLSSGRHTLLTFVRTWIRSVIICSSFS